MRGKNGATDIDITVPTTGVRMPQPRAEERLDNGRPLVAVNDVDVTLAHEPHEHADDLERRPAPMGRDLQVFQPHAADALHQRTGFGHHDHFVPAVAHRAGQLHGVELRSADLHRMRVDEDPHAASILLVRRADRGLARPSLTAHCSCSNCNMARTSASLTLA